MQLESLLPQDPQTIRSIAFEVAITNYFYLASTAIFVYDYIITLDAEVTLLWNSARTPTKVLFLINRYIPFLDLGVVLYRQFARDLSATSCQRLAEMSAWLIASGCCIAEVILTLRTWVIWDTTRRAAVVLILYFIIAWVGVLLVVGTSLHQLTHLTNHHFGCLMSSFTRVMSAAYVIVGAYDLGLLIAIVVKSTPIPSNFFSGKKSLIGVIYRDGILYYAILTGLSVVNMILVLRLSKEYQLLVMVLERVVTSTLTSRVVFNILSQKAEMSHVEYSRDVGVTPVWSTDLDGNNGNNYRSPPATACINNM